MDQKLIDDFKSVHCGCSYCEEKCKYLGNVKSRVDHIKNLQVYIEKMKETQYSVKVIEKILDAVSVNETLLLSCVISASKTHPKRNGMLCF